jgi:hypothetical protein
MVSPQVRREAVTALMSERSFGVTRACGKIPRSLTSYSPFGHSPAVPLHAARHGRETAARHARNTHRTHWSRQELPRRRARPRGLSCRLLGALLSLTASCRRVHAALQKRSALFKQLARVELLVIDDFGLAPLADQTVRNLLEILDDRYNRASTLITSQLPLDQWHAEQLNPG